MFDRLTAEEQRQVRREKPGRSAENEFSADADLVMTHLRPEHGGKAISDHLARAARRLLRTGGIFAVLTHTDTTAGSATD